MRRLQDQRTLLKLVENLREGIYITTWDGVILDANPAFLEVLGVTSLDEIRLYRAGELLVDPKQRRREQDILGRDGWVRDFELDIRRPDGEIRTVLDTAYRVIDPESGETLFHGVIVDITRHKRLEAQLREQAIRDDLTGAHNRRFLAELCRAIDQGDRRWATINLNLRGFRQFNERHGHTAGDDLLIRISDWLASSINPDDDYLIRLGGDELLLVIADADAKGTEEFCRHLQRCLPASVPIALRVGWAVRSGNEPLEQTMARATEPALIIEPASGTAAAAAPPAHQ
jgi:diguanylate cyclase (GGDEF)-like protein/PAS domain S-box-containing protein